MFVLADHIRPLLRDHDCVIIPDFGGLVADVSPSRAQPGRQALSPPTKLVAFNQSLTRNDGLLVDALSQHLGLPIAQAREAVRAAVAGLQRELDETNRTELPGIGIFRRAAGRGLAFEYTGTDNLLAASFGLPELAARPVRVADPRARRPQPVLRGAAVRGSRWRRLLPGGVLALVAGLLLLANYQVALNAGYLPTGWAAELPKLAWLPRPEALTPLVSEPQQATLGQHDFNNPAVPKGSPALAAASTPAPVVIPAAPIKVAGTKAVSRSASKIISRQLKAAVATPVNPALITPAAVEPVAEAAPVVAAPIRKSAVAAVKSTTIKFRTGRYFVIAGAYSSLARAEQGRKVLARTGHAARIIMPPHGSRLYRLAAADYPDLVSAQREAQRLRVSTRCDYNTLKF